MTSRYKRRHLRSPLRENFLYEDDGHAFCGDILNISEGGILLSSLPHVPEINAIPLMFPLPQYPLFSRLQQDRLRSLDRAQIDKTVVRTRARMVRSFEGKSEVDKVFVEQIGCEFVKLDESTQELISKFVATFAKNTVFLLGLFESGGQKKSNVEVLRNVAAILGYRKDEKLSILRQSVLHDYQSLQSL